MVKALGKKVDPIEMLGFFLVLSEEEKKELQDWMDNVLNNESSRPETDLEFITFGVVLAFSALANISGFQANKNPIEDLFNQDNQWKRIVTD